MAPLQYSCLESPVDRGAWRATVPGVAKSQTRLKRLSSQCNCERRTRGYARSCVGSPPTGSLLTYGAKGPRPSPSDVFPLGFNGKDRLPVAKKRNQSHIKDFPNLLSFSPRSGKNDVLNIKPDAIFPPLATTRPASL